MHTRLLDRPSASSASSGPRSERLTTAATALGAGFLLFLCLTLPKAIEVWTSGIFLNPDDAMRAVQLRDFMGGQGWFDLVPRRLSPDHPFVMHWSRLVDAPLAAMMRLFALALPPSEAERAMRMVEPPLLFLLSLSLMIMIVRDLIGPRAQLPAALLLAGSVEFIGSFLPGHIHHHGIQATVLLGAAKLTLDALRRDRMGPAGLGAGLLAALSLGIGLQNLPFLIGLAALVAVDWAWRGDGRAGALAGFGVGLAGGGAAVFVLDVPPSLYTQGACDALSAAHLLAAGLGGLGFVGLGSFSARLRGRPFRFLAAAAVALIAAGAVALVYPACLHDPMAGVDPLLRTRWLADVGEALPLARLITLDPPAGLALALTLIVGLGANALACCVNRRGAGPWLGLLVLGGIGFAGTLYQVRVAASTCAFLIPGVTWLVGRTFDAVAVRPQRPALLTAILVGLVGNGVGPAALAGQASRLAAGHGPSPPGLRVDPKACFEPAAYDSLNALPPGLVLSTIDPGSAILAYTGHSVLAAPYHRNGDGNRVALLALPAEPEEARPLIERAKADYIALCRTSNETAETAMRHPASLSARLLAGDVPPWLSPIGDRAGTFLLFRVVPAKIPSDPAALRQD